VAEKAKAQGIIGYPIMVQSSGEDMKKIADLMENGAIKSHVSQVFEFDQMKAAHLSLETGKTQGKIVIRV